MVTENPSTISSDVPQIKKQIGRLTVYQGLLILPLASVFIADILGILPNPPGSMVFAVGTMSLASVLFNFMNRKKKKLASQLTILQQTLGSSVPPIAEPQ